MAEHGNSPIYKRFASRLTLPDSPALWLGESRDGIGALFAAALSEHAPLVLVALPNTHRMDRFSMDTEAFLSGSEAPRARSFPMIEKDRSDSDAEAARARALNNILEASDEKPALIITCIQALMQPVPDPRAIYNNSLHPEIGEERDFEEFTEHIAKAGYVRTPEVTARKEWTVKGSLVDIWPLTSPAPFRLEFFGDSIESLRTFDPGTQRTTATLRKISIPPVLQPNARPPLISLLPGKSAVIWFDYEGIVENAARFEENRRIAERFRFEALQEQVKRIEGAREFAFGAFAPESYAEASLPIEHLTCGVPREARDPELMAERRHAALAELEEEVRTRGEEVRIWLDTEGVRDHLAGEIGDAPLLLRVASLSAGFRLPELKTTILSQADLYGHSKRWAAGRSLTRADDAIATGERLSSIEHIAVGDPVVHLEHGIGRYRGMNEIELNGERHEVLTIEYADKVKLHVPVWQAHLLSRYVGTGGAVNLHSLGGRRWNKERQAAREAVEDLASSMLDTQARRNLLPGVAFKPDTMWLHEFEASFPYAETPDQSRCIAEVKKDMQSPHPMDRLVCGDAGYGKTEVALRAAFISAMQGRQVAVLVPTTVLAQQHFDTFRDRMAPYPINIAMHSRFCTPRVRSEALNDLRAGKVDIIIGTHGLLRKEVEFKELGLVIIDEEQRFGVGHKEHFRALRTMVDVLTLSATPIPRTLQLGLTGVRDLSLLQTPPSDRVTTDTRVMQNSDEAIRNAVERELERGGQVYFLYNRVLTIEIMLNRLEALFPRARIAVGHGQMPARQIEEVMRAFAAGETDILLCTTIIESGLDIPRANTIIVDRADRFGLADLYQLRGRVGRGPRKGNAVFLTPPAAALDSAARERLKALRQHSGAGAGFRIALRDLGIRGAGNILGAAQSGHIAAVGFTLYCQLLERTVAKLKGEPVPAGADVEVRLDFVDPAPGTATGDSAACLPYLYIEEETQRIAAYRRLASCGTLEEIAALREELEDRYGKPPPAVKRLLRINAIRVLAAGANLQRVDVRRGQAWLFRRGVPLRFDGELPTIRGESADDKMRMLEKLLLGLRPAGKKPADGRQRPKRAKP